MDLRFEIGHLCCEGRFQRVQAIYEFLLKGEDLAIELLHDRLERSKFLLALHFKGGSQVSDFHFESFNLKFSLGHNSSCLIFSCICRYVRRPKGRVADKSKGGRILLPEGDCGVVGLSVANGPCMITVRDLSHHLFLSCLTFDALRMWSRL